MYFVKINKITKKLNINFVGTSCTCNVTILVILIIFYDLYYSINFNHKQRGNMKQIIMTLFLVFFTSSVYAGSCPMMAKNIDNKIKDAQKLRDAGLKAHKDGKHAESEKLLSQALKLFKN